MIIWIMGLNGAGKSSVAQELEQILNARGRESIVLDGNHLREVFEQQSYDRASRIALGIRYAQLASTLSEHSRKVVIIAANGMLKEVCEYNRLHLREYYEVFLDVPLQVRRSRDSSGIFTRYEAGLERNVGGLDLEVDTPQAHLHIAYDESHTARDIAREIDTYIHAPKPTAKAESASKLLSTKAKTLQNLAPKLRYGKILPVWTLSCGDFVAHRAGQNRAFESLMRELESYHHKHGGHFIVRSSARAEDRAGDSQAGAFESVADVELDSQALSEAIGRVFHSYTKPLQTHNNEAQKDSKLTQSLKDNKDSAQEAGALQSLENNLTTKRSAVAGHGEGDNSEADSESLESSLKHDTQSASVSFEGAKRDLPRESIPSVRNSANIESLENNLIGKQSAPISSSFRSKAELGSAEATAINTISPDEIVLIQPMLRDIACAGVAFNIQPKTNAPYYIIEYALHSTSAVTSGSGRTQSFYVAKNAREESIQDSYVREAVKLMRELEALIPDTPLDVEFALLSTQGARDSQPLESTQAPSKAELGSAIATCCVKHDSEVDIGADSENADCHADKSARNDKNTESAPHANLESKADSEVRAERHALSAIESHSGDKRSVSPTLKASSGASGNLASDCKGEGATSPNLQVWISPAASSSPSPLDEKENTESIEVGKTLEVKNEDSQSLESSLKHDTQSASSSFRSKAELGSAEANPRGAKHNSEADSESLENDLMSKQSALISQSFRRRSGIHSRETIPSVRDSANSEENSRIYCLQVRPLVLGERKSYPSHSSQLALLREKIDEILKPHPYLHGERGILGVMPDWNPAEIIGLHPRPLAFSLYCWLITDSIYATMRARYGYQDVSQSPLIYNLHGKPYVDVRASFNSLLPHTLGEKLSSKLMDYYLDRLRANPHLHDKVEFEILFESYYFDTPARLEILLEHGFSKNEIRQIAQSLKAITNAYFTQGIYKEDMKKVEILSKRYDKIAHAKIPLLEKIYWLLQDCRSYGSAPFVGLARMGFVAVGFLNALVKEGILTQEQKDSFVSSLDCVTSHFAHDVSALPKGEFLRKYGHLRPGTYDILSPRYDEYFESYFQTKPTPISAPKPSFHLSLEQMRAIDFLLKSHEIHTDVLGFFDFIATGIKAREEAKFEFSKNLSLALSLLAQLGGEYGLGKEDMSYCDIGVIFKAQGTSNKLERLILESIEYGKSTYLLQQAILLPPLITQGSDVESFCIGVSLPNFITQKRVCARVARLDTHAIPELEGAIVCISRADPGFDWIFSHGIAGLVTEFGGANSHMAIRANELGIPAAIGCGEKFESLASASMLELDCANARLEVLQC